MPAGRVVLTFERRPYRGSGVCRVGRGVVDLAERGHPPLSFAQDARPDGPGIRETAD